MHKVIATSTVIVICHTDDEQDIEKDYTWVLLGRRSDKSDAYPGYWCLPGGFKDEGESLEQCAVREILEETNLTISGDYLDLVNIYSKPNLDPRGEVVSSCWFYELIGNTGNTFPEIKAGDDLQECKWILFEEALNTDLAFNHKQMLKDLSCK